MNLDDIAVTMEVLDRRALEIPRCNVLGAKCLEIAIYFENLLQFEGQRQWFRA
jgi:hypothetical protein